MASRPLAVLRVALALGLFGISSARAQTDAPFDPGPELRPLRVGLAPVLAPLDWGRLGLERGLKESLRSGLDALTPPAKVRRAGKQLGLRGRRARSLKGLARAGRKLELDWVLRVKVSREGWLYTARALLIRTDTAEVQMDFRSGYYKPKKETRDRGRRIGLRTLEKLTTLLRAGDVPRGVLERAQGGPRQPPPSARAEAPRDGDAVPSGAGAAAPGGAPTARSGPSRRGADRGRPSGQTSRGDARAGRQRADRPSSQAADAETGRRRGSSGPAARADALDQPTGQRSSGPPASAQPSGGATRAEATKKTRRGGPARAEATKKTRRGATRAEATKKTRRGAARAEAAARAPSDRPSGGPARAETRREAPGAAAGAPGDGPRGAPSPPGAADEARRRDARSAASKTETRGGGVFAADEGPSGGAASASARAPAEPPAALRAALTAGAGIVRTYDLSAPGLERSALSYALDPLSLFGLRVGGRVPGTALELEARGALRLVRFAVPSPGEGAAATPSGTLLDTRITAGWGFGLDERARFRLVPKVGARLSTVSVDEHPGPVLLGATSLVLLAGVGLEARLGEVVELGLGLDGGPVVLYEESPAATGAPGLGWAAGGDVDLRLWLTPALAVVLHNRFTYDAVPFEGAPSRRVPVGERESLRGAQLGIRDLRASLGVALRI